MRRSLSRPVGFPITFEINYLFLSTPPPTSTTPSLLPSSHSDSSRVRSSYHLFEKEEEEEEAGPQYYTHKPQPELWGDAFRVALFVSGVVTISPTLLLFGYKLEASLLLGETWLPRCDNKVSTAAAAAGGGAAAAV